NGLPFVDLGKGTIASAVLGRVPAELALEQGILPVKDKDGGLIVAVADQLKFLLGCEVVVALAAPSALKEALRRYYGGKQEDTLTRALTAQEDGGADAPIVRLATRLFKEALEQRASDIHIEPKGSVLRVRFRVDGVL